MPAKPKSSPKLTDAERHARFVAMAREVEVDESPGAFDKAFKKVVPSPLRKPS
jgi:hypothetical protein